MVVKNFYLHLTRSIYTQLFFVLIFSVTMLQILIYPFSVEAKSINDCSIPDLSAPGNVATFFNDTQEDLACDVWDTSDCVNDEYCMKWLQGSVVTCGSSGLLDQFQVSGDGSVFADYGQPILHGEASRQITTEYSSNFNVEKCVREKMRWDELRMTSGKDFDMSPYADINRRATLECMKEASSVSYQPSACSLYGTNTGNIPYDFAAISQITAANKAIVVLVDINMQDLSNFPNSYLQAKPLIVRIKTKGLINRYSNNISQYGDRISRLFKEKGMDSSNLYLVFGNELNNPIAEEFCVGVNPGDSAGLVKCGNDYQIQFDEFVKGVAGRFLVAPAPLDLLNADYLAEFFKQGASSVYGKAKLVAANIYCPSSISIAECYLGDNYGLGFYSSNVPVIITEFGTADIAYGESIDASEVQQQVSFIESNCGAVRNVASSANTIAITPLIKNCENQKDPWLFYNNGPIRSDGSSDDLTCSNERASSGESFGNVNRIDFNPDDIDYATDFARASFKYKMWTPGRLVQNAYNECRDYIVPCANNQTMDELYCTNPTPVYQDGPLNTQVCGELFSTMGLDQNEALGGAELPDDYMDRFYRENKDFQRQVLAITESKAGTRAFIVAYSDKKLKWLPCVLGKYGDCYQKQDKNEYLQGANAFPLQIIEVRVEGPYQTFRALRKLLQTLSTDKEFSEYFDLVHYQPNPEYFPKCPDNFVIPKEVCEKLDKAYSDPKKVRFYKQLIARLAEPGENNTCESGTDTQIKENSGPSSNAKPSGKIVNNYSLEFSWRKGKQPPTEEIPTTTTWIIADESTEYVSAYTKLLAQKLTLPDFSGYRGDSGSIFYKHPLNANQSGSTQEVARIRTIDCAPAGVGDCGENGKRTIRETSRVNYSSSSENVWLTLGGDFSRFLCSYYRQYAQMPDSNTYMPACEDNEATFLDKWSCVDPNTAAKYGVKTNPIICAIGNIMNGNSNNSLACTQSQMENATFRNLNAEEALNDLPDSISEVFIAASQAYSVPVDLLIGIAKLEGSKMWNLNSDEARILTSIWLNDPLDNPGVTNELLEKVNCTATSMSSAGAKGPMQFIDSTFTQQQDAAKNILNDNRKPSVCNITDAVFAAARYVFVATNKYGSDWENEEKICAVGNAYYGSCNPDQTTCNKTGTGYCDFLLAIRGKQASGGTTCQKYNW